MSGQRNDNPEVRYEKKDINPRSTFWFGVWILVIMVVVAFLPQWLLVRRRRHVAVEALTRALPAGVQRALDVFAALCGIAAYGILGWAAWIAFDRAWLSGSLYIGELELMAWPGRLLVVIGLAGGLAACLLELLRAVTAGAAGQAREGGSGR